MAKPATPSADAVAPARSNKVLIIIVILAMAIAAGGGWYFVQNGQTEKHEVKERPAPDPRFIAQETFTVNLQHEVNA